MSGSDDLTITRRSRAERPERQVHREEPEQPQVVIEGYDAGTPEAAIADTAKQIKESADRANAAEKRARDAEAARVAAEAASAAAARGRQGDRAIVVQSIIESAQAELEGAKLAYKTAREAGNIDDEVDAQALIAAATSKLSEHQRESAWLAAEAKRPAPVQQTNQTPPAVAAWFDSHPRFQADDDYRAYAEGLHNAALRAGKNGRDQDYVDWIEARLTQKFGEGHGTAEAGTTAEQGGGRRTVSDPSRDRGGDSLPPSRGNTGRSGGMKEARIPLGHNGAVAIVRYEGTPNNPTRIKFASREDADNFREGARLNARLYEADPDKALVDYVTEHLMAHDEGYDDLRRGDGETFGRNER